MVTRRTTSSTTSRDASARRSPLRAAGPALLLLALACGDVTTDGPPLAGTPTPPPVSPPVSPPVPQPLPAPSIGALSQTVGSTNGETPVGITGIGLQDGATVYFGSAATRAALGLGTLYLATPAHVAGVVDVVVRNPDGSTAAVPGGFTYVAPSAFSFDGVWSGFADQSDGTHQSVDFTVEEGRLVRLAFEGVGVASVAPAAVIGGGALAYTAADGGAALTGRMVSPTQAAGVIRLGTCGLKTWQAEKR